VGILDLFSYGVFALVALLLVIAFLSTLRGISRRTNSQSSPDPKQRPVHRFTNDEILNSEGLDVRREKDRQLMLNNRRAKEGYKERRAKTIDSAERFVDNTFKKRR
jgi:hypothetical protein